MSRWRERSVVLAAAVVLSGGCSRPQEPSVGEPVAVPGASRARPSVPSTDSSLSIKRGTATLSQDRMSFRPCDENVEMWLLDQTDGSLSQHFAAHRRQDPTVLYLEAYGERAGATEEVPAARAYSGTFVLEQVLYAVEQDQVRGCEVPVPDYVIAARGNEPFWAVEVGETTMTWRQPSAPARIDLGAAQKESLDGAVRYRAASQEHRLELLIDTQTCQDSMSGELFAFAAKAILDDREFTGCARLAK